MHRPFAAPAVESDQEHIFLPLQDVTREAGAVAPDACGRTLPRAAVARRGDFTQVVK